MKQHTRSHTSFDEAFAYEVLSVVEEIPEGKVATYGPVSYTHLTLPTTVTV